MLEHVGPGFRPGAFSLPWLPASAGRSGNPGARRYPSTSPSEGRRYSSHSSAADSREGHRPPFGRPSRAIAIDPARSGTAAATGIERRRRHEKHPLRLEEGSHAVIDFVDQRSHRLSLRPARHERDGAIRPGSLQNLRSVRSTADKHSEYPPSPVALFLRFCARNSRAWSWHQWFPRSGCRFAARDSYHQPLWSPACTAIGSTSSRRIATGGASDAPSRAVVLHTPSRQRSRCATEISRQPSNLP